MLYVAIPPTTLNSMGFVGGLVQYDTSAFTNAGQVEVNLSLIVVVFLLSNLLHKCAIDQIRTICSLKKNLHYWVTSVATGTKIRVSHFR